MIPLAITTSSSVVPRLFRWRREAIAPGEQRGCHEEGARRGGRGAALLWQTRVRSASLRYNGAERLRCRTPQRWPSRATGGAGDGLRAVDERGQLDERGEGHADARLGGESELQRHWY